MSLRQVGDREFDKILAERLGLTVVAFLSYYSIPCDHILPELQVLAKKTESRVVSVWINTDDNPSITEEWLVKAVPTTLFFRNGEEVGRFEGPYSREVLLERVEELG